MKDIRLKNTFLLLLTAGIWGFAFVAQSVGMEYVEPFTFNCVRSLIGGFFLSLFIMIMKKRGIYNGNDTPQVKRITAEGGILCGIALFAASNLQQHGIMFTTVGKAGFITALYIVIVPIMGLFLKKKCSRMVWISVITALIGFYRLSMKEGLSIAIGDGLVLACAVVFSVHILIIDHYTQTADGVRMSCIQFYVCGFLSGICMFIFETPSVSAVFDAWAPVLYAGILSCGVAYTLQIVGQKGCNPTIAALILSLESVFSVLAGRIILGQIMSSRELSGCVLIFIAVIIAQIAPE